MKDMVKENMVLAVEPKIGLPGIGMVGTENTYFIGKDGPICLTGGPVPLLSSNELAKRTLRDTI